MIAARRLWRTICALAELPWLHAQVAVLRAERDRLADEAEVLSEVVAELAKLSARLHDEVR